MTKHTRPSKGAILIALSFATGLVACKTSEKPEPVSDLKPTITHNGLDPDSISYPASAAMSGAEFLEMNKQKQGVVTLPSGLQYLVIDEGNGIKPELEDSVLVHYKMINLSGEVLDDSRDTRVYASGKPQSFAVAKVMGGWREALLRMPEGSRWKLYVPSDLAYGSTGIASVRGNETLIYEIELFKVKSIGPPASPDLDSRVDLSLDPLF